MAENVSYYVLREKAVPEVLLKVVEAKRLIDSGKAAPFRMLRKLLESVEVLFISIRMTYFRITKITEGRP